MKERKIDYENILKEIKNQIYTVMEEDYSYYKNYNFVISSEQMFIKDEDLNPNNIFIVVRFLPASINFGQIVLPITITAMSEENKIKVCQTLFNDLAQTYNLQTSDDKKTRFIYESPRIQNNFTNVGTGFRSLIQLSATFVVSKNANFFSIKHEDVEIPIITTDFNFSNTLDTQPFYHTNNISTSVSRYGTLTISFVVYLLSDIPLTNEILDVICQTCSDDGIAKKGTDNKFRFDVEFSSGHKISNNFKLSNVNGKLNIGDIPLINVTFTL